MTDPHVMLEQPCQFIGGPLDGQSRAVAPDDAWYFWTTLGGKASILHIYTREATQPHRFLYYEAEEVRHTSRASLPVSPEESNI